MIMGYLILIVIVIGYILLLYNFPIATIIITLILLGIFFGDDNTKGKGRPNQWINGYYKKDGTFVEGHWKSKRGRK